LDRLKLVLVGNLAGAQFAYEFANRESESVAGFVCINPYYFTIPPSGVVRKVPGFFLVTENEHPTAATNVRQLFSEQRKLGALWAMISWDSSTQTNLDGLMTVPFVEQALIVRIKRKNPIGVLESLGINDGWSLDLSQLSPPTITESRNVPRGQEDRFAWFVSENLAEAVSKLMVKPTAGH
jgi:pimeloyl-ACP methyl ester carboxylesterase